MSSNGHVPQERDGQADAARNAIYDRVSARAPEADGAELAKLAEAFERVTWGPQGGRVNTAYRYHGTVVNSYDESRNGRRAGFAAGDGGGPPELRPVG